MLTRSERRFASRLGLVACMIVVAWRVCVARRMVVASVSCVATWHLASPATTPVAAATLGPAFLASSPPPVCRHPESLAAQRLAPAVVTGELGRCRRHLLARRWATSGCLTDTASRSLRLERRCRSRR